MASTSRKTNEKRLMVVQARKSVSTDRNEAFAEKYVFTKPKNCFFWQKNQKWFPLKCFSVKIDSP